MTEKLHLFLEKVEPENIVPDWQVLAERMWLGEPPSCDTPF